MIFGASVTQRISEKVNTIIVHDCNMKLLHVQGKFIPTFSSAAKYVDKHVGVKVELHTLLTSALDGRQLAVLHHGQLTPERRSQAPTEEQARWTPEFIWTLWGKFYVLNGN